MSSNLLVKVHHCFVVEEAHKTTLSIILFMLMMSDRIQFKACLKAKTFWNAIGVAAQGHLSIMSPDFDDATSKAAQELQQLCIA